MMCKIFCLFCFLFSAFSINLLAIHSQNDIHSINEKLFEVLLYYSEDYNYDINHLMEIIDTERGVFYDLDYSDQTNSEWQPDIHWRRLSYMSKRFLIDDNPFYNDNQLLEAILNGVDFWIKNPQKASNGWWNLIGVPMEMGTVLILMQRYIDPVKINKCIPFMNLAVKPDFYDYYGPATGQNLLWETFNHIMASVLSHDNNGLMKASKASAKEIVVTTKEGIQPDYSFYQHGNQSYSFGYGKAFSLTAAQILYSLNNTKYSLPDSCMSVLSNYLLEGQQWCSYKKMLEYTSMGREIARPDSKINTIIKAADLISKVDIKRKHLFKDFISQLKGESREKELRGVKSFPRIDLMVNHGNDFFFSVKSCSNRIVATETGNGENLKGYYLGYGTQFISRRGDEYEGIFPLWNWKQLPGSIAEQDSLELPVYNWTKGAEGTTEFVYSVSKGDLGIMGYDYEKNGIKALRCWACFPDKVLSLTSLSNIDSDKLVFETLNQCFLKGNVFVDGNKLITNEKTGNFNNIWHDSICYHINGKEKVYVSNKKHEGAWKNINNALSDSVLSLPVFTVSGVFDNELDDNLFSYFIIPNVGVNDNVSNKIDKIEYKSGDGIIEIFDKEREMVFLVVKKTDYEYILPDAETKFFISNPCVCILYKTNGEWKYVAEDGRGGNSCFFYK